jgi:hypothetical protein
LLKLDLQPGSQLQCNPAVGFQRHVSLLAFKGSAPTYPPPTKHQELLDRLRGGSSSDGGSPRRSYDGDGGTGSGIAGDTFLHKAVRDRDVPALRRLLAGGADPNQQVGY